MIDQPIPLRRTDLLAAVGANLRVSGVAQHVADGVRPPGGAGQALRPPRARRPIINPHEYAVWSIEGAARGTVRRARPGGARSAPGRRPSSRRSKWCRWRARAAAQSPVLSLRWRRLRLALPSRRGCFIRQRRPPEPEIGPQKVAAGHLVHRQTQELRSHLAPRLPPQNHVQLVASVLSGAHHVRAGLHGPPIGGGADLGRGPAMYAAHFAANNRV